MSFSYSKLTFTKSNGAFRTELLRRVDAHFTATGRTRYATPAMWLKSLFWSIGLFTCIGLVSFLAMPSWLAVLCTLSIGFFMAGLGFNVGHDAIHGSYSKWRTLNAALARSFDIAGGSSRMWAWAHNVVHHTYTNVPEVDHDLDTTRLLRFYRQAKRLQVHRLQHIYAWLLYCFTSFIWVFKKDFEQLQERRSKTDKNVFLSDVMDVCMGKAAHFAVYIGLPLLGGEYLWWQILLGYCMALTVSGFTLAVVFQLAHVVEGPEFPVPDAQGNLKDDFFVHQLKTTSNFSPQNPLVTFIVGGLNYQIEHHLFPRICHVHYPELAPIVRAYALQCGLPYYEHPSFFAAMASHTRVLHQLGRT